MQTYERQLQAACEKWFKSNFYALYTASFTGISLTTHAVTLDTSSEISTTATVPSWQLTFPVGPWKGVCIAFKAPGETLLPEEKAVITRLREQGQRVFIIRYVEDFQTTMQWYLTNFQPPAIVD